MATKASKKKGSTASAKGAASRKTTLPVLGKGEINRGITLHEGKLAHLIELPGEFTGTHVEATKWAKEQGGELPSRIDGIVLFDGKCGWARDWYWLAPQPAAVAGCAWGQGFGYGSQGWDAVSGRCRARAVRRVVIQ